MNKIFKIVFNKETGVFTAVAEFAKAQGKSSSCTVGSKSSRFVAQTFTLTALAAGMMLSSSVWAYSSLNGRVTGGDADKTLAMMDNAVVQASEGIAIGNSATSYSNASGQSAQNVAIGHEAKAITGAVAIGYQANTLNSSQQKGTNQQSVAIGYQTVASGDQSTALGAQSKAAGNSSVAIGGDDLDKVASSRPPAWDDQTLSAEDAKGLNNTVAAKKYEQLTGDILVHFENSLVRGNQVTKTAGMPNRYTGTEAGEGSVAVGVQSQAKGSLATAFGTRTSASGTASVALGVGALATNDGSFAGAAGAQSTGISSIALGTGSKAQGNQSLAMGDSAQATADNAYAIGTDAKATEVGAIAQGFSANATAISAISIGRETNATKENAVALSRLANATGEAANAIGFRSEAHGTNSVALGTQTVATAGATAAVAIGEQANASNTKSIAIGAASKSSGDKSIAVGDSANATNTHSFAMGGQSLSTGTNAVAVGSNTKATGNFSTAISNNANASAHQALAVGVDSVSSKTYATAIGSSAKATGTGSYAGGREANATADYAIAVGNKASSAANGSIAIGNESSVISTGTNSVALGYKASATQQSSTSLGREATTASNYSTAVGANANVGENLIGAVALGTFSTAQAGVSTNEATVNGITYSGFAGNSILHRSGTESYVVSVGDANTKRQIQNVAAGQITKTSTDAINGSQLYMVADEVAKSREKVTSDDKTVTVKESKDSSSSTVFDLSINKSKLQVRQPADDFVYPDAVVVEAATGKVFAPNEEPAPTFVTADVLANTVANSGFRVAGNGTATEEVVNPGDTVNFVDGNGTTANVSVVDGKNTIKYDINVDDKTITVGDDGKLTVINNNAVDTNDIAKVVAGDNIQVDAKTEGNTTTFTVATKKDLAVDSVKAGDTTINNDGLKVGDVTVTNSPITVNGNTVNNINDAINQTAEQAFKPLTFGGDKGNDVTRKLGEKVNVKGGATGELSSGNIAVEADGTDTLNIKLAKELKDINSITINNGPTINNNGINMDGDKITNLKDGEDDGDAVNVKQLKESKETVISKDNSIKVTTGKNANGANEFDLSVNKTELKDDNKDGKVDAPSNEDGDKLVDAKTVADAINNSGFKLTTSASAGEVSGTTEELINPGDIVTIDAGNNIKVTQAAGKITVETKDNVTFGEKGEDGKPGKDGSVGVNGKDGSAVTLNGKDGSIGLNGKDGKDGLTFKSEAGPQGVNGDKGENGLPGKDGTTRIVYQPTNPDGTPNGEPEQVATLNDGLIFTGNNEALNRHKLNTVVKIVGDGVDKAASDSFKSAVGNINVVADKNDTLTIQLNKDLKDIDSITVNNGPTINGDGINMNGDTITNLGDGKEDGDAVNVKQMKASRTTVTSSDNSISVVDTNNGKGDNFAYDIKVNNQAVVENAQTPVVYTNKDGDKVYKQPDGTFNTKPDGTGNNVKPADVIASMNSGDNSTNNPTTLANVKSNLAPVTPADKSQPAANNPADLADKLNNAATVGDVLNAGWNLQGNGTAVDTVVHNDTVNFVNGVGTTAKVETTDGKTSTVTYDVNVDNKTITTEEVADPNNPGNKITQIKANTTELKDENKDGKVDAPSNEDGDKLVNAKNVADAINSSGFNLKTSATEGEKLSGDDELINPGDSVEMVAGKNLTVKQEANGKVTYATKDDIVLGEKGKDGKPGKDGSVGVNGKDGSGVSLNGKDGSIGLNGKDGKDGLTFKSAAGPQGVNGDKGENGLPGKDGTTRIVYQPTNPDGTPNGDPEQVATLNDGLIFTGNNELLNRHKLNTVVKIVGDGVDKAASDSFKSAKGNINVVADKNDTLTIQLNKDLKDIDSITVNNGPTINGDGINMNGDTITNLGDGKEDGDAVNVKQMKASRTTVTSSDNSISVVDTNNGKGDNFAYDIKVNNQAVVENAQTPVVYTNKDGDKVYKQPDGTFNTKPDGTGDKVNPADVIASMNSGDNSTNNPTTLANVKSNLAPVTPADKSQPAANNPTNFTANQLNNAATLGDVLNAGWNLQGNGKAVDTVVHNDTVNFVNGVGTTAKVETTDGKTSTVTYDVNVDNKTITTEEVADPNNPGNKITQIKANTTELKDENKDGKVDAPSNEDGDKLVNAKNVADAINSSGFNLKTSATEGEKLSGDDELINPGDSVEMIAGKNLTVKQEANGKVTYATKDDIVLGEKGKDGKPGKDGSVGVNGKDGSGVSLNGKDGSIGLNGKDGKDGLSLKSADGAQGVDGTDGESGLPGKDGKTRLVYQPTKPDGTPNGEPEQVATLNDGLIFTGNNEALNRHKLNTVVKIVGDGVDKAASDSFKSAKGNINVVADKNDTLTIQLNKDLKDIDSITVNNGPTINGDGINMNGDTITNLGDGKEDGDAVNVKQMKASRTTVTSSDNSISVVDTNNGKGDNFAYDIKVNNQAVVENAQIPVVYTNKDGDKVYKQPDGTFNTKPDGTGNNVKPADVIASMNSGDNSTNNPTTLANVKSNLAPVTPADKSQPAANNPADLADKLNNAATVGDVLNAGWNLQGNGTAVDTVVHNDTVNFVNGVGTTARVETTDGKTSTVTYDVNVDNKTITTEEVADPNNPGNKITQIKANTTELKDENKDGKVDAPSNEDGDKLVNAKNVADAINSSGFNLKTSATDGEKLSGDDELINPGDSVEMIAGKNLTVKQEANGKVTYATKDDVQFNSVTSNKVIVGDAADPAKSSTLTSGDNGLDVGGDKITNVADGDISPVSTDVINGKQLNNYTKVNGNNIGTDQDGSINIVNGNGTTVTSDKAGEIKVNVNNTDLTVAEEGTINVQDPNGTGAHYVNANTVAKAVNEVSWSVNSETDKATANAATQNTYKPVDNKVKAGSQVKVNAGRNVEISGSGRNINVAVSDNPEFNSVKVGGTKLSSKVAEDGVNELNIGGNNNAPTRITNVAAGVKNTDAVNVSQLKGAVNNLDNKINRNNRDLRAGIAGANAAAGLPQVYIPGKSMVAAAAGTFKGENALAVGYSRSSDNGKVILKLQGNANTRGDLGGSVGVGYQW